jgi:putative DNA primase/helicase
VNVRVGAGYFDQSPYLFNAKNGTVDLKTGALLPHERDDRLTQICPVPYDQSATCPQWEKFLLAVFGGKEELVGFVRRLIGSALVGTVTENILPILWGTGANGKSVLVEVLLAVFGPDYAMKAPPSLFMARRTEAHPTERADLYGKRFVAVVETAEGGKLDEALVKELTGGDRIRSRKMRQDFWEFTPTHTAILVTNHKPEVTGNDHGIWRRLKLVPFTVTFWNPDDPPAAGEERPERLRQDKGLREKLLAERPGILAWAVRGCLEWQKLGLLAPAEVSMATAEFREQSDQVRRFVEECCERPPTGADWRVRSSALYGAYRQWCDGAGERAKPTQKFGPEMERLGFEKATSNGIFYRGLRLLAEGPEGPEELSG